MILEYLERPWDYNAGFLSSLSKFCYNPRLYSLDRRQSF